MILPICKQTDVTFALNNAFPMCIMKSAPIYRNYLLEKNLEPFGVSWEDGSLGMGFADGIEYGDVDNIDSRVLRFIPVPEDTIDYESILSKIEKMIEAGYYLIAFIDEYYIYRNVAPEGCHYARDFLVYGIDENSVYAFGFNSRGILGTLVFPRYKFALALINVGKSLGSRNYCSWIKDKLLMFLKPIERNEELPLRPSEIKRKLEHYIEGEPDEQNVFLRLTGKDFSRIKNDRKKARESYGRETKLVLIDHVRHQLEKLEAGMEVEFYDDYRFFHMYKEQCQLALARAEIIAPVYERCSILEELKRDMLISEEVRLLYLRCKVIDQNAEKQKHIATRMLRLLET